MTKGKEEELVAKATFYRGHRSFAHPSRYLAASCPIILAAGDARCEEEGIAKLDGGDGDGEIRKMVHL